MTRVVLSLAVLVVLGAPVFAQVPAGPEFRINTYTTGNQPAASHGIASSAFGDFVVVWEAAQVTGSSNDVFGQRYDAAGVSQGGEFRINTYTTGDQILPSVAAAGNGNFVVVWNSNGQSGNNDVFAQRYDRSGAARGVEFRANSITPGEQFQPWVAADAAGNFVIAWETDDVAAPARTDVFARLFDREGNPRGPEFRVNTYTTDFQFNEAAAFDGAGSFVVVWTSAANGTGQDGGYGGGIFGQRFNAAGARIGQEFRVNSYTTGQQRYGSVAAAADGRFVVTWMSDNQDGSGYGVFAQRYDRLGAPQGGEFRVNSFTTGSQTEPRVTADPNGNFAIAWNQDNGSGSSTDVVAKRYDAGGLPRGGEFRVNAWTTYTQSTPQLASDAAGNFVVAWQSFPGQDGNGVGLFGQRFGGIVQAPLAVDAAGNRVFEPGETVVIAPSWRNASGQAQAFTGTASAFTGPGGPNNPTYTISDGAADYGVVAPGALGTCATTGNCYSLALGTVTLAPAARPVLHWDATFREDIAPEALGQSLTRVLHIGDSFADVSRSSPFYRFIETILHLDLTGGCGGGNFCPLQSTPREQMAVFVLVAKEGAGYQPPACVAGSEMFNDVPASSPFCRWIEELAHRNIAGGCGGGNFCPLASVSREQMAVFALATREAAGYSPAACVAGSERFADVPASSPFCRWIEELARRNIAGGCGGGNFCPIAQVTREQNAVFVSGTFGLVLY